MEASAVALHLLSVVHGTPTGPALVASSPDRHFDSEAGAAAREDRESEAGAGARAVPGRRRAAPLKYPRVGVSIPDPAPTRPSPAPAWRVDLSTF